MMTSNTVLFGPVYPVRLAGQFNQFKPADNQVLESSSSDEDTKPQIAENRRTLLKKPSRRARKTLALTRTLVEQELRGEELQKKVQKEQQKQPSQKQKKKQQKQKHHNQEKAVSQRLPPPSYSQASISPLAMAGRVDGEVLEDIPKTNVLVNMPELYDESTMTFAQIEAENAEFAEFAKSFSPDEAAYWAEGRTQKEADEKARD